MPIPAAPVAQPGEQIPPQDLAAHAAWVKGQREVALLFIQNQAELGTSADVKEYSPLQAGGRSICYSHLRAEFQYARHGEDREMNYMPCLSCMNNQPQWLPKKDANPALHAIRAGRVQKNQKNKPHKAGRGGKVFETFKVFQREVENQLGKTIKSLRSDRGGHIMRSRILESSKGSMGSIAHRTPPYTPQNNGVSERRNRTLLDMVRSMMSQTTLPKSFWDYALETAARILNMVPSKKVDKTPYEIWHCKHPLSSPYLIVWVVRHLLSKIHLPKPDKLDPRIFKKFLESKLLDLKAIGNVKI
ncbi:retrotransposon protein, putative, ty1-copia subclass [Tanacetum coccineum]